MLYLDGFKLFLFVKYYSMVDSQKDSRRKLRKVLRDISKLAGSNGLSGDILLTSNDGWSNRQQLWVSKKGHFYERFYRTPDVDNVRYARIPFTDVYISLSLRPELLDKRFSYLRPEDVNSRFLTEEREQGKDKALAGIY